MCGRGYSWEGHGRGRGGHTADKALRTRGVVGKQAGPAPSDTVGEGKDACEQEALEESQPALDHGCAEHLVLSACGGQSSNFIYRLAGLRVTEIVRFPVKLRFRRPEIFDPAQAHHNGQIWELQHHLQLCTCCRGLN